MLLSAFARENSPVALREAKEWEMGTYDRGLEGLQHFWVALDFLVTGCDGRDENCNVSVGLCQRVADLAIKLHNVMLNLGLSVESGQKHLLDHGLEIAEPVLRFLVAFLLYHDLNS